VEVCGLAFICLIAGCTWLFDWLDPITGTVSASIADIDFVKRREGIEELFEDGTVSFLSIVSIRHGFKILSSLTVSAISRYIELYKLVENTSPIHDYSTIYTDNSYVFILVYGGLDGPPSNCL